MNADDVRDICLGLPAVSESYPFGPDTPVFKTTGNNRVFAITSAVGSPNPSVTVKSDPHDSEALRQNYPAITPGYHMNKRHWITVMLDGTVPDGLIAEILRESYALVRPKSPTGTSRDNEPRY